MKKNDVLVTQVGLIHPLGNGKNEIMTTWVDSDPKLVVGLFIKLKKHPQIWQITDIYGTQTANDIDARSWDNNDYGKHTGLGIS